MNNLEPGMIIVLVSFSVSCDGGYFLICHSLVPGYCLWLYHPCPFVMGVSSQVQGLL